MCSFTRRFYRVFFNEKCLCKSDIFNTNYLYCFLDFNFIFLFYFRMILSTSQPNTFSLNSFKLNI